MVVEAEREIDAETSTGTRGLRENLAFLGGGAATGAAQETILYHPPGDASPDDATRTFNQSASESSTHTSSHNRPATPLAISRRRKAPFIALALALLLLGGGAFFAIYSFSLGKGKVEIRVDPKYADDVEINITQGGKLVKVIDKSGWTISLTPGTYDVELGGSKDKFKLDKEKVAVTRNGHEVVNVTMNPHPFPNAPGATVLAPSTSQSTESAPTVATPLPQITNSIGMKLNLIPSGEFTMGSTKEFVDEQLRLHGGDKVYCERLSSELPPHKVRITRQFYLGVYTVTRGQFRQFVHDTNYKTEGENDHNNCLFA
jgi:hypothetical protein